MVLDIVAFRRFARCAQVGLSCCLLVALAAVAGCSRGTTGSGGGSAGQTAAPVISSFSASPSTITAGQSSTLSWSVTGATSVTLSGQSGAAVSPVTVSPTSTTTYTLTATNAGGTVTATATVTVNAAPTTFSLTVVNGYGSGTYAAGTSVDVFADAPASGQAFLSWSGNTSEMADPESYHTTVTATAGSTVTVTANYSVGVPAMTPTVLQVPGTNQGTSANRVTTPVSPAVPITIGYVVPASHPMGIIFEFHGSQGTYKDWYVFTDNTAFGAQALAAGYGIVAVNSAAPGYWDYQTTYPNNLDFNNLKTTIGYLEGQGVMSSSDKLYGIGVSDGGYYGSTVSRVLGFHASYLNIAAGLATYFDPAQNIPTATGSNRTLVPTIFGMAQNDGTSGVPNTALYSGFNGIGPAGVEQGYCNATELQTLAIPVPSCDTTVTPNPYSASVLAINFYVSTPSPAYPGRFAQVDGLSASTAQAINTWMQTQGCINASGYILFDPYQSVDYNASPANFKCSPTPLLAQFGAAPYNLTTNQANNLMNEFLIAYAEHKFMAEFNDKALAFFAAH